MSSDESRRKRQRTSSTPAPAPFGGDDSGLGGLYDFLPPPDPANDAAAKDKAEKDASKFTRPKLPPEDRSRVIFLDVDGVLLPTGSVDMITVDGVSLPARPAQESDFAASALGNLRSIVQKTGATIVLSSEWRRTEQLRSSFGAVLKSHDIPALRDITPIFHAKPELDKAHGPVFAWCERRAREIGQWLKEHKEVTSWVALDDLDFAWADSVRSVGTPWMKIRSVHTDAKLCLEDTGAEDAVRIILNPPPEPKIVVRRSRVPSDSGGGPLASTEDSMPERIRLG